MYCPHCGKELADNAVMCPGCGAPLAGNTSPVGNEMNSEWLITLLFCIFLGTLGIHSFYNRKIGIGIAQLLTFGGCGIWAFVDFILIVCEKFQDAEGRTIRYRK